MSKLATGQITLTSVDNSTVVDLNLSTNQNISQEYSSDSDSYLPDYSKSSVIITPTLSQKLVDVPDVTYQVNGKDIAGIDGVKKSGNNLEIFKNIGEINLGADASELQVDKSLLDLEITPLIETTESRLISFDLLPTIREYLSQSAIVMNSTLENIITYTDATGISGKTSDEVVLDITALTAVLSGDVILEDDKTVVNTEVSKMNSISTWLQEKMVGIYTAAEISYYRGFTEDISQKNTALQAASGDYPMTTFFNIEVFKTVNSLNIKILKVIDAFLGGNYTAEGVNLLKDAIIHQFSPNSIGSGTSTLLTEGEEFPYYLCTPSETQRVSVYGLPITCVAGEEYNTGCWIKQDNLESMTLRLSTTDPTITPIYKQVKKGQWTLIDFPFTATEDGLLRIVISPTSSSDPTSLNGVPIYYSRGYTKKGLSPMSVWVENPMDVASLALLYEYTYGTYTKNGTYTDTTILNELATRQNSLNYIHSALLISADSHKNILRITATATYNDAPLYADISLVMTTDVGGVAETVITTTNGQMLTRHDATTTLMADMYKGSYLQDNVAYTWYKKTTSGQVIVGREKNYIVNAAGATESVREYEVRTVNSKGVISSSKMSVGLRLTDYDVRIEASISETPLSNQSEQTLKAVVYWKGLPLSDAETSTIKYQWYKMNQETNVLTKLTNETNKTLQINMAADSESYHVEIYN